MSIDDTLRTINELLEKLPGEIELPDSLKQIIPDKREVFIAVPTIDGKIDGRCHVSLCDSIVAARKRGHTAYTVLYPHCVYLAMVRSKAVEEFLASPATDLFFVDADQGFSSEEFIRVLESDHEIVGGVPPMKNDELQFPGLQCNTPEGYPLAGPDGLIEYEVLGTGFMRIKRQALERFIAHYGEDDLLVIESNRDGSERRRYMNVFDTQKVGTTWYGEDVNFCRLWRAMGGKLWVDPNIDFSHTGTKTWFGNRHEYLMRCPGGALSTTAAQPPDNEVSL